MTTLLSLPTEIRLIIWKHVFADETIRIDFEISPRWNEDDTFDGYRHHSSQSLHSEEEMEDFRYGTTRCVSAYKLPGHGPGVVDWETLYIVHQVFSLLFLCKALYHEIERSIWENVLWKFKSFGDLTWFLQVLRRLVTRKWLRRISVGMIRLNTSAVRNDEARMKPAIGRDFDMFRRESLDYGKLQQFDINIASSLVLSEKENVLSAKSTFAWRLMMDKIIGSLNVRSRKIRIQSTFDIFQFGRNIMPTLIIVVESKACERPTCKVESVHGDMEKPITISPQIKDFLLEIERSWRWMSTPKISA
jgi:hypothetical protein